MKIPTQEQLKAVVSYCPDTGLFTRIAVTCNRVKVGDIPSHVNGEGYVNFRVNGILHKAHRLAWLYMHGEWPSGQLDHINGIRTDNRICNLRIATNSQNQQNRIAPRKDNETKLTGVGFFSPRNKWRARIAINKNLHFLGYFDSKDAAAAAYMKAKNELHKFNQRATA